MIYFLPAGGDSEPPLPQSAGVPTGVQLHRPQQIAAAVDAHTALAAVHCECIAIINSAGFTCSTIPKMTKEKF